MSKKITNTMIKDFNKIMHEVYNSKIRITKETNNWFKLIADDCFVSEDVSLSLNEKFYSILETFFKKYNIELSYNNTKTIFWERR